MAFFNNVERGQRASPTAYVRAAQMHPRVTVYPIDTDPIDT